MNAALESVMRHYSYPRQYLSLALIFTLAAGCATPGAVRGKTQPKRIIAAEAPALTSAQPLSTASPEGLQRKIRAFQGILRQGGPKSESEWKLHDELLRAYGGLKAQGLSSVSGSVSVPAHSRIRLDFPSFCLNPSGAGPSDHERFSWRRSDPGIPYYRGILNYAWTHRKIEQSAIQEILWNLKLGAHWEEYPDRSRAILQQIDPDVAFKLPSRFKSAAKEAASGLLSAILPATDEALGLLSFVEGRYYGFDDLRRSIGQIRSQYPIESMGEQELEPIEATPLYAETESHGYFNQGITLYNPSDHEVSFDPIDYYLQPSRRDVQRIGLLPPSFSDGSGGLLAELEAVLFEGMLRLGMGFTPGLNDVADVYELLAGRDYLTGEPLSVRERALSGAGLIAESGAGFRYLGRVAHAPVQYVTEFEKGLERAGARAGTRIEQGYARTALHEGEGASTGSRQNRLRTYSAEEANTTFRGQHPPYKPGTRVTEFKSTAGDEWVRVHGDENPVGRWMVRKESIRGMSPEEIRSKYSLPAIPTHLSDVITGKGVTVRMGRVNGNFGGGAGARQYEIQGQLDRTWFKNERPIGERL
ncbi:MAG: pre-toxin TG domain-containing protein [Oligoflexia bacterium]|nr:pre-toxin TG domain-containing protein [Oligoflexia bacterium]